MKNLEKDVIEGFQVYIPINIIMNLISIAIGSAIIYIISTSLYPTYNIIATKTYIGVYIFCFILSKLPVNLK